MPLVNFIIISIRLVQYLHFTTFPGGMLEQLMVNLIANMEKWSVRLILQKLVHSTINPTCKIIKNNLLIHSLQRRTAYWPFLYCMYGHGESQDPTIAEQCANENNMDWNKISSCYQGSFGHQLELEYANETASLNPPHQYTPWVTINDKVI